MVAGVGSTPEPQRNAFAALIRKERFWRFQKFHGRFFREKAGRHSAAAAAPASSRWRLPRAAHGKANSKSGCDVLNAYRSAFTKICVKK
jgi:hypothetical protein